MLQELSFTIGQPSTGYRTLAVHASDSKNIDVRIVRDGFRTSLPAPSTPDAAWLARADAVLPAEPPPMKRCHKLSSLSWQLRYTTDEHSDFLMRQGVFPACWNDFIDWLADITPALDWSSYRLPVRQPGEFIVCGVVFHGSGQEYHYWTEDSTLCEGDWVLVPVGSGSQETAARIESIGYYTRSNAPYPIERMKMVIGRADKTEI
ncbi:hypothetical protein [uncultured Selenomonas sp.]|uniref:hypothetical protein n=1 Tax=uncultured Selenomonas sp. TaxID=159275 RepID=UPI0025F419AA|nr:hypothetical protein [uncultured Selenomonas sp.]